MVEQEEQAAPLTPDEKDAIAEEQERQYNLLREKLDIGKSEDTGTNVDFIIFMLHGIGSTSHMLSKDYRMIRYMVNSIKKHWFYQQRFKTHIHVVDWKRHIIDAQNMLFEHTYITTAKETRKVITSHMLDIGFFLNPRYSDFLLESVVGELDSEITRLKNHPSGKFNNSKVVTIGYSMGSLILHEILCSNPGRPSNLRPDERPRLKHKVDYMFAVGSPLSCFMIFQSPQLMTTGMKLPEGVEVYNIFHPYDPVAFRWERLIYRDISDLPEPELLPYWQNNGFKNWYGWERSVQQAKSMIVENISDVASSISRSIFGWWGSNKSNSVLVNNVAVHDKRHLALSTFKMKLKEKATSSGMEISSDILNDNIPNIEDPRTCQSINGMGTGSSHDRPMEGGNLDKDDIERLEDEMLAERSSNALQDMNRHAGSKLPRRYDFQLQEDITEHILSPLGIIQSHTSYWSSKDLIFFILKKLNKKHDAVPITVYLNSIKIKAKRLADCAATNQLKTKFLGLSEEASSYADKITSEDNKAKVEASTPFSSTWSNLMKSKEDSCDEADITCSDPID